MYCRITLAQQHICKAVLLSSCDVGYSTAMYSLYGSATSQLNKSAALQLIGSSRQLRRSPSMK
jgi:hypothetical protein